LSKLRKGKKLRLFFPCYAASLSCSTLFAVMDGFDTEFEEVAPCPCGKGSSFIFDCKVELKQVSNSELNLCAQMLK